jgi:GH15 family glucan-1,4-alpha-glucosidase
MLASSAQISPAYKYVWIQDSIIDGFALLANGLDQEARGILDFFSRVQKADGDWWVTYHADGRPCELWEHGTEAMGGHLLTLLGGYVDQTDDRGYLQARWPMIERACGWALGRITVHGLMSENRDLWETFTDQSWTYTNLSWISGFREAAHMALKLGKDSQAIRYAQAAGVIETALRARAIVNGYLGKGVRLGPVRPDPAIDASVLASVWPFRVLTPSDSVLGATIAQVESRLTQEGGGVRRWETDGWYGGQGWPELTDWLALATWMRGDRSRAEALHTANTDRAHTTGSLQIGEVFDERTGKFTSAFPLGWPEAQYILTSRALHGPVPGTVLRVREPN